MALFNEDSLKKKLADLNMSQQSIQTTSLWLIHHKKHASSVVNVWAKEITKATDTRKLTFMYLANDVIQNSKKKGPEYNKEFSKRLPKVFEHLGSVSLDDKSKRGLTRLMTVWEERGVFSGSSIHAFKTGYEGLKSLSSSGSTKVKASGGNTPTQPSKRAKRSNSISIAVSSDEGESGVDSEEDLGGDTPPVAPPSPSRLAPPPVTLSRPLPDSEALIQALQALESAATGDAEVREKIASLPTEVTDTTALAKLRDAGMGRALQGVVNDAQVLLQDYNARLSEEMDARKAVAKMLHDAIQYHKDKLAHTEEMLEEYRLKLHKVDKIKAELKNHLQNLPDISRLPNMSSTLAPLPSAGDLFTN